MEGKLAAIPEEHLGIIESARKQLQEAVEHWEAVLAAHREAKKTRRRDEVRELRRDVRAASERVRTAIREWVEAQRSLINGALTA